MLHVFVAASLKSELRINVDASQLEFGGVHGVQQSAAGVGVVKPVNKKCAVGCFLKSAQSNGQRGGSILDAGCSQGFVALKTHASRQLQMACTQRHELDAKRIDTRKQAAVIGKCIGKQHVGVARSAGDGRCAVKRQTHIANKLS